MKTRWSIALLLAIPLLCWSNPERSLGRDEKTGVESKTSKPALVLDVWPGKPPGEMGKIDEEKIMMPKDNAKNPVTRITNVTQPTLTVFRPNPKLDTGAAVLIAPGGGYSILAWDLEGLEVAQWLNSIGVTGIVLKYRVPRRPGSDNKKFPIQPLMDAQRSLRLIRSKAKEWHLDPNRIGMLGFSAGGHLTAVSATRYKTPSYDKIDSVDEFSCRPDFAVMVYPGGLIQGAKNELKSEIPVSAETPKCFFVHAQNDPGKCDNSIAMFLELKKMKVDSELHIYTSGGHGFGLRKSPHACCTWPDRCYEWMKNQGFLKAKSMEKR